MPKKRRLTGSLLRAVKVSTRLHGTFFSLAIGDLPETGPARFTCVVSKKIAPRAASRNATKRRFREAARQYEGDLRDRALIFYAKKPAAGASYEEIRRDVTSLLDQVQSGGNTVRKVQSAA
jgi:ribonuclease P protein component